MSDQQANAARFEQLEVVPGFEKQKLEGWVPAVASEEELRQALEKAFDYRGDVIITRKDGSKVEGYIFDRRTGKTLRDSWRIGSPTRVSGSVGMATS